MDKEELHSVAVAAVLVDSDERVLLMKRRDHGNWEPPGGVLKRGESIADGLTREVFEETGLRVEPVSLAGVYKNMRTEVVTLVFRAEARSGTERETDEAASIEWVKLSELEDFLDPDYLRWIADARDSDAVAVVTQTATIKGASSSPG